MSSRCLLKAIATLVLVCTLGACGNSGSDKDDSDGKTPTPTPSPTPATESQESSLSEGVKVYDQTKSYAVSIGYNPETVSVVFESDTIQVEVSP